MVKLRFKDIKEPAQINTLKFCCALESPGKTFQILTHRLRNLSKAAQLLRSRARSHGAPDSCSCPPRCAVSLVKSPCQHESAQGPFMVPKHSPINVFNNKIVTRKELKHNASRSRPLLDSVLKPVWISVHQVNFGFIHHIPLCWEYAWGYFCLKV